MRSDSVIESRARRRFLLLLLLVGGIVGIYFSYNEYYDYKESDALVKTEESVTGENLFNRYALLEKGLLEFTGTRFAFNSEGHPLSPRNRYLAEQRIRHEIGAIEALISEQKDLIHERARQMRLKYLELQSYSDRITMLKHRLNQYLTLYTSPNTADQVLKVSPHKIVQDDGQQNVTTETENINHFMKK